MLIAIGLVLYLIFLACERAWPLRRNTQSKVVRVFRNISIGIIGSGVLRFLLYPWLLKLAHLTESRGWGLLGAVDLPTPLRIVLAFLALDYFLFWWHWANHHLPFLWRFHNVHHTDLDLDISTAARFHLGELLFSAGPRALEIVVLGLDPLSIFVYDTIVVASTHFHHSNLRLPARLDEKLSLLVVTPRMHGIHHSIVQRETNSNFSTVFSFWDRLHRSLRLDVPHTEITIGVPAYRDPRELTFRDAILLPIRPQRPWVLPDGGVPER